jgi:WD40 repeat protein
MFICVQKRRIFEMKFLFIILILMGLSACAVNQPIVKIEQNQQAAEKVDNKPMLRLNTQMHTASIRKMSIDAQQRFVVTGSHDKTARVWDLQTGDLLQVLRPPIGNDDEGKIFAVAISPDGETIAIGGWTGKTGQDKSIYLFKRNGELINKINGLPNVILHLIYSPDGQFLVACLWGDNGIRIYKNNQLVTEDKNYGADSYWADFDAQGRLVTSSHDGKIRLYDKNFNLINSIKPTIGKKPYTVRFNPNGNKIAIGFADSPNVQILSGVDLSLLYEVDPIETSNGSSNSVAWSVDGKTLLASGKQAGNIYSWSKEGKGQRSQWVAVTDTIIGIQPLQNGNIVIASQDPLWGVFKPNGEKILQQNHNIADFRDNWDGFLVSNQGDSIQFGYEPFGKKPAQFSLTDRELQIPTKENKLSKPRIKGLKITDWKYKFDPKLNDKLLTLKPNERSRSLAIAPDNKSFVLGTSWYLRFFDQNGSEIWKKSTPSDTWAVNIPQNGKTVVAALGDGTIRWYRLSDGVELLAFFPHNDGKRWVLWTPSGYYAASAGAEELIGWHVNNGPDRAADFFEVGQFRDQFYRPDIIDLILEKLDENQSIESANAAAGIKTRGAVELPPVARLLSPYDKSTFNSNKIKLQFQINLKTPDPITELITYWNERPHQSYKLESREESLWTGELNVLVPPQDVVLKISVKDRSGRVSNPNNAQINLQWTGTKEESKPRLNILAIGVNDFSKELEIEKLKYPSTDAKQFIQFFEKQSQLYRVNTPVLLDRNPTKNEILEALENFAKNTHELDVNMVFLAGHAENDSQTGEYHFLPSDFERKRFRTSTLSRAQLKENWDLIKGKVLVFVDTCHAGNIGERRRGSGGDFTKVINTLISADSGIIVFAAASALQSAIEKDEWGNGAFTKALMEALSTAAADSNKDGIVDFSEIQSYVGKRVFSLTNERQTPVILAPNGFSGDYPIAVIP